MTSVTSQWLVLMASMNSLSGSSFQNIGDVMQSTAPAIVDLFADLMPRAHAAQIDHVPALAMQFSNDCLQIADVVESMAQTSSWVPNESVERLRELSDIAFAKQVVRAIHSPGAEKTSN